MAHATLKFQPGVNKTRTMALNEVALSDSNLVRFTPDREGLGLVQKLGGWQKFFASQISTLARALWAWEDTNADKWLGVGGETVSQQTISGGGNGAEAIFQYVGDTVYPVSSPIVVDGFIPQGYNGVYEVLQSKPGEVAFRCGEFGRVTQFGRIYTGDSLYVLQGNDQIIITPRYRISQPDYVYCTTIAGSPHVKVTDPNANLIPGDVVFIETQISVGGIVLFGSYVVDSYTGDQFSITAKNLLGAPTPAKTDDTDGGAVPTFNFQRNSSSVLVTFPKHGYSDGDTFTILIPVDVGGIRLYGNYIVSITDPSNKDQFNISSNKSFTLSDAPLVGVPVSASSDGFNVRLKMQAANGLQAGDKIRVVGSLPQRDGVYTVSSADATTVTFSSNLDWNSMSSLGTFFKVDGGDGTTVTLCYFGDYIVNVGDTLTLDGFSPSGYNGQWTVAGGRSNRIVLSSTATGDIATPGNFFTSQAILNNNRPYYKYYTQPQHVSVTTGYGVGGYGVGGYGVGGPNTTSDGSVPVAASDWTLDNWGEDLVACPVGGPIYKWSPTSGTLKAEIVANAPAANDGCFVAMPQRQIITWGSTFNGIQDPLLVRWCDVSNYDVWAGTVTNQAGSYRIAKGSKIVGGLQGPQQGLIWTDLGLWAMQYTGLPYVYSFNEIGVGCGLISRKAAGSLSGVIYWMGASQFFMLAGEGVTTIPCPIWDTIFQDLDTDNVSKIRFAANSNFGEVQWFYPSKSGGKGEVDSYAKFNTQLNCWDYGKLGRTAWINQSVFGPPIGAGADKFIYQHETSQDADGQAINASFQTGYAQMGEGEFKMFVDQVWPDFRWGYYENAQDAQLQLTFYVTDYPGDKPKAYGPYPMNKRVEFITPRFRGRLVSIKVESNDKGSFWRIGACRYRYSQDGKF